MGRASDIITAFSKVTEEPSSKNVMESAEEVEAKLSKLIDKNLKSYGLEAASPKEYDTFKSVLLDFIMDEPNILIKTVKSGTKMLGEGKEVIE